MLAAAFALSAVTGVAVASVGGGSPSDDPERPTGTVTVRAEPAREGAGPARVIVTRQPGAPARLRWMTVPGTASAGDDFDAGAGFVQFRPGERRKVIEVGVAPDDRSEGAETLDVRLDVPPSLSGASRPVVTTVTIVD